MGLVPVLNWFGSKRPNPSLNADVPHAWAAPVHRPAG
jgi:hypothetical protein